MSPMSDTAVLAAAGIEGVGSAPRRALPTVPPYFGVVVSG